jgi:hypothetical protein
VTKQEPSGYETTLTMSGTGAVFRSGDVLYGITGACYTVTATSTADGAYAGFDWDPKQFLLMGSTDVHAWFDDEVWTEPAMEFAIDLLKVEIEDSTTDNFSPQLGEEATINVRLSPTPPSGGFPDMDFECEIVRKLQGGTEQHIQWIDVDPSTPDVDLTRGADFSTLALTWNGIPPSPYEPGAAQATGPEVFTGVSGNFNRILPTVTAGQCVPPPLYYVVARLKRASDRSVWCEHERAIYVPQVVTVTYAADAISELMKPYTSGTTTIVSAFTAADIDQLKAMIEANAAAYYGVEVNIRVGEYSSISAPYGIASIELGTGASPGGSTPAPLDFGNADCAETSKSFVYRRRLDCGIEYVTKPSTFVIPVSPSELSHSIALTTLHEIGHQLGLVAANQVLDGTSGSHNKPPIVPRNIMNAGLDPDLGDTLDAHLGRNGSWSFRALNLNYIEFVLPQP